MPSNFIYIIHFDCSCNGGELDDCVFCRLDGLILRIVTPFVRFLLCEWDEAFLNILMNYLTIKGGNYLAERNSNWFSFSKITYQLSGNNKGQSEQSAATLKTQKKRFDIQQITQMFFYVDSWQLACTPYYQRIVMLVIHKSEQ